MSITFVVLRKGSDHQAHLILAEEEVTVEAVRRRFKETLEEHWEVVCVKMLPGAIDLGIEALAALAALTYASVPQPEESVENALRTLIKTAFEAGREDMKRELQPK